MKINEKKILHIVLSGLWLAAAILLVSSGIGLMLSQSESLSVLASWIGVLILIAGLGELCAAFVMHKNVFGDRSYMTRGLVTAVAGLLVICQNILAGEVLRVVICMMILVSGTTTLSSAFAMNKVHVAGCSWLLIIGLLETLFGLVGFLRTDLIPIAIGIVLGVSLIVDGLNLVYTWWIGTKWYSLQNL